jgi:hypothetical protein
MQRERAAQDDELLAKGEDLDLKPGARPKQQEQHTQQRLECLDHGARALHDSASPD